MPLSIETFSNIHGGNALFKAITHPLIADKAHALMRRLRRYGNVAIFDPLMQAATFGEIYDLTSLPITDYFVQDIEHLGAVLNGRKASAITEIKNNSARQLFITAFDTDRHLRYIRHLLPPAMRIAGFDDLCLPKSMRTDRRTYLTSLNFATNFVFFRDSSGNHTRLTTVNYWGGYGAKRPALWCRLYDEQGGVLAQWREQLGPPGSTVIIDSQEVRAQFGLPAFTGQLFVHVIGGAGHDVVKYTLDTYGHEDRVLSCTHDANAWPADFYAGLPAPDDGEDVVLWVQNSLPTTIPPNELGLRLMGDTSAARLQQAIAPFGTYILNVNDLLPQAKWPQQIEVLAGKYFARPRYEVYTTNGRCRIAHVNVERTDLKPDLQLAALGNVMGKGHILPAPVLPLDRFDSLFLPTPMAIEQAHLPLIALIYDGSGKLASEHRLGNLPRNHATLFNAGHYLAEEGRQLASGYGHLELVYDLDAGKEADGWFHALFRYIDRNSSHISESSFGAHIFNTVLTYKNEPQSYSGRPPGLSTKLFLRIGEKPYETFCHLIYPASTPWHEKSDTELILFDRNGNEVAKARIRIPCSGSYLWTLSEIFSEPERKSAREGSYVIVRDSTCRLFGYQGLRNGEQSFSLDHMFGF